MKKVAKGDDSFKGRRLKCDLKTAAFKTIEATKSPYFFIHFESHPRKGSATEAKRGS
jgi:hypothetical protein